MLILMSKTQKLSINTMNEMIFIGGNESVGPIVHYYSPLPYFLLVGHYYSPLTYFLVAVVVVIPIDRLKH